uniref:Uncharacterized protein n=1 Tax=Steinernema glaseri TaxID=37863 RepID=A0A1I7ZF42_9BILA
MTQRFQRNHKQVASTQTTIKARRFGRRRDRPMLALGLLAVFLALLNGSVADECKGCQAYDCFEDTVRCGEDSYLLKYGGKYCRKFNDPVLSLSYASTSPWVFSGRTSFCNICTLIVLDDKAARKRSVEGSGKDGVEGTFGLWKGVVEWNFFRREGKTTKSFSPIGREFLDCTTTCLKHFMQNYINSTSRRPPYSSSQCSDLEKAAFDSHVKCYLDCDFCTVCKTEKAALFRVYEFRDFLRWSAIKQMFEVLKQCGGPHKCFALL